MSHSAWANLRTWFDLFHQVVATAPTTNPRIEAAFAAVPREKFRGAPPWKISNLGGGYRPLHSSDLVLAYQDVLFALQTD
ncbi:hypothetical protein ACC717_37325, partial [Rhizobium ruizarguesonis]